MPVVLPQFLVVERFEGLDGRHVRRERRSGFEQVAETLAAAGEVTLERIARREQHQEEENAPLDVAAHLAEAERQVFLGFQVVDRLRRGVDLERRNLQIDRIGAPERVEDVLVGVEHLRRAEVVFALVECGQPVALAQFEPPAVAFERVDRAVLDQLDLAVAGVEYGEFHDLHQILLHVDDVIEAVADHNAVGFYARRDRGRLLRLGRESREKKRYCKESFHRCLNSFINSAT